MTAMKVQITVEEAGLNWKLFNADFQAFAVEEVLMTVVETKVELISFLFLPPPPSMSFGISSTTGP